MITDSQGIHFFWLFFLCVLVRKHAVRVISVAWLLLHGCVSHDFPKPVDCNADPIVLEVVSVGDTECGMQKGHIEVVASGGSGMYSFILNDGDQQSSTFFANLAAGIYEITATDDNLCTAMIEATIKNKDGMNLKIETSESGCFLSQGSITVTPIDGIPPFQFKIGNKEYQPGNHFAGLAQGQYVISAKDSTGCEVTQPIRVRTGISYANIISPIIKNNCAINTCHNGSQFPDFRVFQNIRENATLIKTMVVTRKMPENGTLTQEQINSIVCWVDDEAPDN